MGDTEAMTSRRGFLKALGCGAVGWALPGLLRAARRSTKRPNFVLFLVDDLGWRDLGCYGSTFYETPHIDRLCRDGTKFTQAYAAGSVCSPTRASIITGRYPARTGCTNWGGRIKGTEFPLARAFRDGGYDTFFAGKWHIGNMTPSQAGFEVVASGIKPDPKTDPKATRAITAAATQFLRSRKDKPFLAFVSYFAVHTPLRESADVVEKYRRKLARQPKPRGPAFEPEHDRENKLIQDDPAFAAMTEVMDDSVGRIVAAVKDIGAADDTVVIFFSDNGGLSTKPCTANRPLRAGKGWLYEGGIREPLITKWPGVTKPGSTCDTPVVSTDFFPTMLEMAGLPLRPKDHCDGVSLAGLLRTGKLPAREAIYWHYPHRHGAGNRPSGAIRLGDWKLIQYFGTGTVELYNLRNDLGERKDLAGRMPQKRDELLRRLEAWRKSIPGIRFGQPQQRGKGKRRKQTEPTARQAEVTAEPGALT